MSSFAIQYPFFIIMLCLVIVVVGVTTVARMPVDLFPRDQYSGGGGRHILSGMPPQQIEADITDTFERFFTLGSGIDHIESRSLTGVSLIKVYFQPGTNPDAAVSEIESGDGRPAAIAAGHTAAGGVEVRCFQFAGVSGDPEGPGAERNPVARSGQFTVRNQIANVPGASVPQPFGGSTARYRSTSIP